MTRKNAFTLAELLAVITILGVIALIVFPAVNKAIKNSKEKSYNQQVESILGSAENWTLENMSQLSDTSNNYITIDELQQSGYLEAKRVINPNTDEEMNGCVVIKYDNNYNQYAYEYNETNCDELRPTIYTFQEVMEQSDDVMNNDPDGNLRYVGLAPNNYVWFNNELWRIIGIFNGQTKIIRNDYYESNGSTIIKFDSNDSNNWAASSLQLTLNNTTDGYITTIQANDPTSYSYIDLNHVWNVGETGSWGSAVRMDYYTAERSEIPEVSQENGLESTWTGAIGLMYVSDYGYSTSGTNEICDSMPMYYWNGLLNEMVRPECVQKSWLYDSIYYQWTLTRSRTSYRQYMSFDGAVSDATVDYDGSARPVVFLKTEVKIVGGNGTEQEPYELGM